jgi:hypothetical protein
MWLSLTEMGVERSETKIKVIVVSIAITIIIVMASSDNDLLYHDHMSILTANVTTTGVTMLAMIITQLMLRIRGSVLTSFLTLLPFTAETYTPDVLDI